MWLFTYDVGTCMYFAFIYTCLSRLVGKWRYFDSKNRTVRFKCQSELAEAAGLFLGDREIVANKKLIQTQ